jgi:parvulin-like peptidyl-prolyl isomerase
MNTSRFKVLLGGFALTALLLLSAPARAQTDPNAVFATVNGEDIKSTQFWHRLAWYRFNPNNPLSQLPAGFLAINQLITEKIVYEMGRDKGISLTDDEIAAEIKTREDADPNLLTDLKAAGRPESDLYDEVKYEMMQYKLKTFGITITDQEVEKHYQDYPSEFTNPKRFKLRVIVVSTDSDAVAVDQELAAGKNFSDIAVGHSQDVSAGKGGEFGVVTVNQLGAPAVKALDAIKIGEVTPWVTAQGSPVRVRYQIEDIMPAALQPLDPTLRNQIRKKLSLDKGEVKNHVLVDLHNATINAKVVINQAGFQKMYDEMVASYKKAHPTVTGG